MGSEIASNVEVAAQKKAEMLSNPADHDTRARSYEAALSKYAESLSRDANALEQIGLTFQEADESIARSLLGIGG